MKKNEIFKSKTLFGKFLDFLEDDGRKQKEQDKKGNIKANERRKTPDVKSISIGITSGGDVVNLPLFENRILICGSSGSGKSVVANEVLNGVFSIPEKLRVVALVDMKGGIEISPWIDLADGYATEKEYTNLLVYNIEKEMMKRQKILMKSKKKKMFPSFEYPLIVLFIDELAEIADSKDKINLDTMDRLRSIFRLGRATGIVPVVCLQRPDSKILSGDLKNNINTTICGKVRSEVDTKTVFGNSTEYPAHELQNHWFYFVGERYKAKFKTPYETEPKTDLTKDWIRTIVKKRKENEFVKSRGKFLYVPKEKKEMENKTENTAKKGRKTRRGRKPKTTEQNTENSQFGFD